VVVWANKSDYKDFIRMYIVSDYFKNMSEKERLGGIFSMLDSSGAKGLVRKISLCIAMTNDEYEAEFGGDAWVDCIGDTHPVSKPPKQLRRISKFLSSLPGYKERVVQRRRPQRLAGVHR
jgi:hypothetical protein